MEKLKPEEKQKMDQYWGSKPNALPSDVREQVIKKVLSPQAPKVEESERPNKRVNEEISATSGIQYDGSPRGRMIEEIVTGIMKEKTGNLEWIVSHWIDEAPEDVIKDMARDLKIRYIPDSTSNESKDGESLGGLLEKTLVSQGRKRREDTERHLTEREEILKKVSPSQDELNEKVNDIMGSIFR
jgi:hypothetical protein